MVYLVVGVDHASPATGSLTGCAITAGPGPITAATTRSTPAAEAR